MGPSQGGSGGMGPSQGGSGGWVPPEGVAGVPGIVPGAALAGSVDRGQDRAHRGRNRVRVDADAPEDPAAGLALHVRRGLGVGALGQRVLGVVKHPRGHADGGQRVAERRDGTVAHALDLTSAPVDGNLGDQSVLGLDHRGALVVQQRQRALGEVLLGEDLPHPGGRDLPALGVGVALDHPGELDLQAARQVQLVFGLHDVGHAALAGLRVDPDDRLVGAAHVMRVDGQVRNGPRVLGERDARVGGLGLERFEALLDRVLVGTGERGVYQVARVGVARVDRELVAVLDGATDLVDVGEVDHRVDALAEQVQPQRDQAYVAGTLAVAEQAALDPVGAREHGQLGVGDGGAPVVVRVDRHAHVIPVRQVPAHPLDLVGVDVRGGPLDRARQVEDDLAVRPGLPDVHDARADVDGEVELGVHEDLGRVLIAEVGAGQQFLGVLHDVAGALDGQRLALLAVDAEHYPAEYRRGGVVQVHGGQARPAQRLDRALDQVLPGLGEHGDPDIVGDAVALDQLAHEVEVGLARGREPDLDLLVAHPHQQVEHLVLAGRAHRVDQRLVAVPEIGRQPARGLRDGPGGPGAVGQLDRLERRVAMTRHATRLLMYG